MKKHNEVIDENITTEEMEEEEMNVTVVTKRHPVSNFIENHPKITAFAVGVLGAIGGVLCGMAINGSDDYIDDDFEELDLTDGTEESTE